MDAANDEAGEDRVVCRFEIGDDVPSWLIDVDPCSAKAVKPKGAVFVAKGAIVKLGEVYWVLPDMHNEPDFDGCCMALVGGNDVMVFAPGDYHVAFVESTTLFMGATTGKKGDGVVEVRKP